MKTVEIDGAVYEVPEGTLVVQTERGELTIYGSDDDRHAEGEYVYQLASDASLGEEIEHFELKLENDFGDTADMSLDINAGEDVDVPLGNLMEVIEGSELDDNLNGGEANNDIYGYAGNDIIDGGLGNDLIAGGAGSDDMYGGEGSDTFIFLQGDAAVGTVDTIHDYEPELDVLDFADVLGEVSDEDLGSYLVALEENDEGEAVLSLATDGDAVDQQVVFASTSIEDMVNAFGLDSDSSGQDVINAMIEESKLITQSF
nr:calcium-binding protein [Grimontia sedimenti]